MGVLHNGFVKFAWEACINSECSAVSFNSLKTFFLLILFNHSEIIKLNLKVYAENEIIDLSLYFFDSDKDLNINYVEMWSTLDASSISYSKNIITELITDPYYWSDNWC